MGRTTSLKRRATPSCTSRDSHVVRETSHRRAACMEMSSCQCRSAELEELMATVASTKVPKATVVTNEILPASIIADEVPVATDQPDSTHSCCSLAEKLAINCFPRKNGE
ncbi:unnamed protein product [Striga asiatica]|uniref:Uncharacterized protein n=1 Tax=Striga asiatica TaxID=4170 RepID=A0A5A7RA82_STRAF|nr:unnamed protein product [Striga asiatica]